MRISHIRLSDWFHRGHTAGDTTNFAFGGPNNQYIYMEGAVSGTFWRFKTPYPGLVGPGGVHRKPQP